MSRVRAGLVAAVLALSMVGGMAWAYWSAGSGTGGNGAAVAATIPQGATPAVDAQGDTMVLSWAASTLSNGQDVAGYEVRRYSSGAATPETILSDCAGTVRSSGCTESQVPGGSWEYTITPVLAQSWRGAESERSTAVTTDETAPVNALTLSEVSGGAATTGDTVYYRGAAAGSLTLTNTLSDAGSGPASSATSALTGDAAGWSHTPSTVSSPPGGPYVSAPFGWTASTSGSPTETVTGRDVAGNTTATMLTFADDSTPPANGTLTYPDGFQDALSVDIAFTPGTDTGSGVGTRRLQRSSTVLAAGACDTFGAFADLGPESPVAPYTDASLVDQTCYRYRYVVTDRVGNRRITTSPSIVRVDSGNGGPALRSVAAFSVLGGTGVANTGPSTVSGDLGVPTVDTVTGFPPGIVSGTVHNGDAAAVQARADLVRAYDDANALVPDTEFAGDQNGRTFTTGVHHTSAAFALTGTMTLDAEGDPDAVFVFQVDAAMNTAAASHMVLVDGARASNVFWQVQGAVGAGANATVSGTLMAAGAITLGAGTELVGRALSYGLVTMSTNAVRFTSAPGPTVIVDGGATAVTKDTTPTLSGTTSAPTGTTVRVAVEGQRLTTTAAADGTWTVTVDELGDGTHEVTASVRDSSGNSGSASQSLTVEVNPAPVALRSAASYSVLAGVAVASTGATTISGDLGVSPGSSVTGFPPGIVSGSVHAGDAAAATARADVTTLYDELDGRTPRSSFSGDLAGRTFHGGVFHTSAALALTGTVTLDAEGDPDAVFVFQVDAAMNTAAGARVVLVDGAEAGNVFWQVQGAVGSGATSQVSGTIVTAGGITLGAGTELVGRALSYGTVTLAGNAIRFTSALPPTVSIAGGATARTKDTTPTLSGDTSAAPGTTVTVTVDGQVLTTTAASDGAWSVTADTLADGAHDVTATVRDPAGNAGTATQSLTVEVNPAPVALGSAASYSVLAATGVANTGLTVLSGDLGVTALDTISGFPPGIVSGSIHNADAAAVQAQADLMTAYADADARTPRGEFAGDLGGRTFPAGVFHTSAALALTGTVTLDAEGDPDAVFVFQVDAAMNTAAGAGVVLANGAQTGNVFWQVQGDVGTGASTELLGTVLTAGGVTLGAGTRLTGRALSRGTVTLATNDVS